MPDYERERMVAIEAARLAGQLCLAVRREMLGENPDEAQIEKAGKEPVTIADYGAQAIVLQRIAHHFPDDGTVAEERATEFDTLTNDSQKTKVVYHVGAVLGNTVSLDEIRGWLDFGRQKHAHRIWAVDPIDGTKGFLRGNQFAVAVALLLDGQPIVGALACPLLPFDTHNLAGGYGVVAAAVRGRGAMLEALDSSAARPLAVSTHSALTEARAVESVESGHTDHSFSQNVFRVAGLDGAPVRMDSQAKYVAVADGRAEVYIRHSRGDYREKIWDHAAGVLIVQEAGGTATDLDGRSLDFSKGEKLSDNRGILAANALIHESLLDAIRAVEAATR